MSKAPDFDELVGTDLPSEERERLRRAHELLLAAGPPEQLPPALAHAPDPEPKVSFLPQRRRYTLIGIAATLALAAFGAGYFSGGARHSGFTAAFARPMHGNAFAPQAQATIRIAAADSAGNWPMRFSVAGLKPLPKGGYYELYLSRGGQPVATCGTFIVHGGTTTVALNAPYSLRQFDGWVVTRHLPRTRGEGTVLMTT